MMKETHGGLFSILTRRDMNAINEAFEKTDIADALDAENKHKIIDRRDFRDLEPGVLLSLLELHTQGTRRDIQKYGTKEAYGIIHTPEHLSEVKIELMTLQRIIQKLRDHQKRYGWKSYRTKHAYLTDNEVNF